MAQKIAQSDLFQPVTVRKMPEIVFEDLREKILTGVYRPGQKLPSERTLMTIYEKSHPTIREALRLLESAGYIRVIPGGGAVVLEIEGGQIEAPLRELLLFRKVPARDIVEFLFASEPAIAGIAAERRTWEDLAAFSALTERQNELRRDSETAENPEERIALLDAFYRLVKDYHVKIATASHNPLTTIVWSSLFSMLDMSFDRSVEEKELQISMRRIAEAHDAILGRIRAQDGKGAAEAVSACFDTLIEEGGYLHLILPEAEYGPDPMKNAKASAAIYEQIRSLILQGKLEPGERLPAERQLVEAFGRSRASVREALKMLEMKNYVTITRGSGTVVNDISTSEIERALDNMLQYRLISKKDIQEVRGISEAIAAEWAAARRTPEDLEAIRETITRSNRYIHDRSKLIDCGIDFTNAMTKAAHNEAVHVISRATSTFLHDRYRDRAEEDALEEHLMIIRQHTKIMHEIEKGSVSGAREATLKHLEGVEDIILE